MRLKTRDWKTLDQNCRGGKFGKSVWTDKIMSLNPLSLNNQLIEAAKIKPRELRAKNAVSSFDTCLQNSVRCYTY